MILEMPNMVSRLDELDTNVILDQFGKSKTHEISR